MDILRGRPHVARIVAEERPIRDYALFESAIDHEAHAKGGYLSCSPVHRWLRTSGTTGRAKRIPYTQHWMRRYRVPAMLAMWHTFLEYEPRLLDHCHAVFDTQSTRSGVTDWVSGVAYQAISNRHPRIDGFDWNPPWYESPWYRPSSSDGREARLHIMARHFVGRDPYILTAINPSTLLGLNDFIGAHADEIAADIAHGTFFDVPGPLEPDPAAAKELLRVVGRSGWTFRDLWPNLDVLSCWTSAGAEQYLPALSAIAPGVTIVPFMTCGTEGVVTIPIDTDRDSQPLAIDQAIFEFIPVDRSPDGWLGEAAETLDFSDVRVGEKYHLVMSQGNGLLRLWVGDIVEVMGWEGATPRIRFVERYGIFHSFTGEKLTHDDVSQAFRDTFRSLGIEDSPYIIAPRWDGSTPEYVAVVEGARTASDAIFSRALDQQLSVLNIEYDSKRASGRLGAPRVKIAAPGQVRRYFERQRSASANENQFKFRSHQESSDFFHQF